MTSLQITPQVHELLNDAGSRISVLSGAGISAESGIPTFRGPEGYWTLGSRVYMPEEMATLKMFTRYPDKVWEWYLYRLGVCLRAVPNAAHHLLAQVETQLGKRFKLITQNVDNLHLRAGNSPQGTLQIHGNIHYSRCSRACSPAVNPLDDKLLLEAKTGNVDVNGNTLLHCPACGEWLRPHVLWFDEYYAEAHFGSDSALRLAAQTDLLIVIGTSGATSLPRQIADLAARRQATIIDINTQSNPFSELARGSKGGMFMEARSCQALPALFAHCSALSG